MATIVSDEMQPLHPGFGVTLRAAPRPDLRALGPVVADLVRRHHLVVVRDLPLSTRRQLHLAAAMGTVVGITGTGPGSRRPAVRSEIGRDAHEERSHTDRWHADQSWSARPDVLSVLSCVLADDDADPIQFACTTLAHEQLDDELAAEIDDLAAHHHVERSRRGRDEPGPRDASPGPVGRLRRRVTTELHRAMLPRDAVVSAPEAVAEPGVPHPVVGVDPESGRRFLRLGDHAWRIVGCDEARATALLPELNERAVGVDNVVTHRWSPGDLVVYDNRMILHRRSLEGVAAAARELRRVLVLTSQAS